MLERNDELISLFNKEEQKRQRLQRRKRDRPSLYFLLTNGDLDSPNFRLSEIDKYWDRRKRVPQASKEYHKLLDRLDEMIERQKPAHCVSKKWVG